MSPALAQYNTMSTTITFFPSDPTILPTKKFYLSKDASETPLLLEPNYSIWGNLMRTHLDSINTLDIVLSNKIQPEENDTECENWKHRGAKARVAINGACALGIRGYMLDYSTIQKI
jgi:hypothetical protein